MIVWRLTLLAMQAGTGSVSHGLRAVIDVYLRWALSSSEAVESRGRGGALVAPRGWALVLTSHKRGLALPFAFVSLLPALG